MEYPPPVGVRRLTTEQKAVTINVRIMVTAFSPLTRHGRVRWGKKNSFVGTGVPTVRDGRSPFIALISPTD